MFDILMDCIGDTISITLKSGVRCTGTLEILADRVICVHADNSDNYMMSEDVAMVSTCA